MKQRNNVVTAPRRRDAGHRRGGGREGHGRSPFRGVTGVLRSHTAHQEGRECLVPYVKQGKAGEVPYLLLPNKKRVVSRLKVNA